MPLNKNASFRYRLIDECLCNRSTKWTMASLQRYVSEKLLEHFDVETNEDGLAVSLRSLKGDIAIMRKDPPLGYAAPIICRRGEVFYDDPSFTIHQHPLNGEDIRALHEATLLLKQFSVFPHYRELQEVVSKCRIQISDLENPGQGPAAIQFERNDSLTGIEYLEPLYHHIRNQTSVLLVYQPFRPEAPIRTVLHPYLLKEFNNRWFLFGWDQAEKAIRNYPLDRIQSIEPVTAKWFQSPDFHADTYFKNVLGVTVLEEEQVENVLLEATAEQAKYIKTKPIHHSQEIVKVGDSSVVFSFHLIPNYELESLLLSFGQRVKVLAPASLVKKIAERLGEAGRQYSTE
ncbi:MAG: WYL domain-containing protein [Saprospiraceae bacterium]